MYYLVEKLLQKLELTLVLVASGSQMKTGCQQQSLLLEQHCQLLQLHWVAAVHIGPAVSFSKWQHQPLSSLQKIHGVHRILWLIVVEGYHPARTMAVRANDR